MFTSRRITQMNACFFVEQALLLCLRRNLASRSAVIFSDYAENERCARTHALFTVNLAEVTTVARAHVA
ncbi:hypothetical protein [Paenibacillus alba]|uniref:hypothetical protein n=1 Tax=Paenibacillus alba TaxID=1197127 RepID=UPI0015634DF6|nr:hypothetical protein [Paenibacillus alba]